MEALFPERALKPGFSRGVAPEMVVLLNPPPLHPAVFWGGVATSGVSLAGSAVLAALWLGAEDELSRLTAGGVAKAVDVAAATRRADDLRLGTLVGVAVSAVVVVATAATAGFVDWRDAGAAVHLQVVE